MPRCRRGLVIFHHDPISNFDVRYVRFPLHSRLQKGQILCRPSTPKWLMALMYSFQRVRIQVRSSGISTFGTTRRCWPIRKWPGVKLSNSNGDNAIGVKGLEFSTASIRHSMVSIFLNVKLWFSIVHVFSVLNGRTAASQRPPKWGAPGGLKCQVHKVWEDMMWWFAGSLMTLDKYFEAPLKLVPQSEYTSDGSPRRGQRLLERLQWIVSSLSPSGQTWSPYKRIWLHIFCTARTCVIGIRSWVVDRHNRLPLLRTDEKP